MILRRTFLAGLAVLAAPLAAKAQRQPAKIARIGFLGLSSASATASRVEAMRTGLRDLGYVDGKNIVIEFRWAENKYDRLPELAAELVRTKVDVLVTYGAPGTRAAKGATTTIPIVIAATGDAVAMGLVASLARPGGNVTGSTYFIQDLFAKRLELLKQALPRVNQVAVLLNPGNPANLTNIKTMEIAAKSMNVDLHRFEARGPEEFESAFAAVAQKGVDAVQVLEDAMLNANVKGTAELAARHRLPSVGFADFARAGGMVGYGVNILELFRRVAYFVDRILKGTKPADLPVEQPTRFELVVNVKTAKALGLRIPQQLLLRADEVIE